MEGEGNDVVYRREFSGNSYQKKQGHSQWHL